MRGDRPYAATSWDVLGWAIIQVDVVGQFHGTEYSWSATLLFADRGDGEGFRWYEIGFYSHSNIVSAHVPFALAGYEPDIDEALGPSLHTVVVAYGPLPIDCENEEDFRERWTSLISKAATGSLRAPMQFPINLESFLG